MRRGLSCLCLVAVTALFPTLGIAGGDEAPDTVFLETGQRVPCRIMAVEGATIWLRIGDADYEFERASVTRIEHAGEEQPDPEREALVSDLVRRLGSDDPALVAAARAGLAALGKPGIPYLKRAADAAKVPAVRAALEEIEHEVAAGRAGARGGEAAAQFLDRLMERVRAALSLKADQEVPVREAVQAFFQDLRGGGDRAAAAERLKKTLDPRLEDAQKTALEAWIQSLTNPGAAGGRR